MIPHQQEDGCCSKASTIPATAARSTSHTQPYGRARSPRTHQEETTSANRSFGRLPIKIVTAREGAKRLSPDRLAPHQPCSADRSRQHHCSVVTKFESPNV